MNKYDFDSEKLYFIQKADFITHTELGLRQPDRAEGHKGRSTSVARAISCGMVFYNLDASVTQIAASLGICYDTAKKSIRKFDRMLEQELEAERINCVWKRISQRLNEGDA